MTERDIERLRYALARLPSQVEASQKAVTTLSDQQAWLMERIGRLEKRADVLDSRVTFRPAKDEEKL